MLIGVRRLGRTADRVNIFCFPLISGCLNCPFGLAQDRYLLDYEVVAVTTLGRRYQGWQGAGVIIHGGAGVGLTQRRKDAKAQ